MRSAFLQDLGIAALLFLVSLLFFWRVPFEGMVMVTTGGPQFTDLDREWNPIAGDSLTQYYPWADYAARMQARGAIPLWNPYVFAGTPFAAKGQAGVFYPVNILLWRFLPAVQVFGYSAILHFFLAGFCTYHYLRTLRLCRFGALVGALAFMLNGYLVMTLFAPSIVAALSWLPAVLYFLEKGLSEQRLIYWLGMGVATGLSSLAGHITATASVLFVTVCYGVVRSVMLLARERAAKVFLRSLGGVGVALLIGLAIGAVQLVPTLELVRLSHRWGGVSGIHFDPGQSWMALQEWLRVQLVPEFYGSHIDHTWQFDVQQRNIIGMTSYIGVLPFVFALFAMLFRRDRMTVFFFTWTVLGWLETIGVPVVDLLLLPVRTQAGSGVLNWGASVTLFIFPLAMLAGFGADDLLRAVKCTERRQMRAYLWFLAALASLTLLFVVGVHFIGKYGQREFSLFAGWSLPDFRRGYQLDSIVVFFFFLVACGVLVLALDRGLDRRLFQVGAVLIIAVDLFLFGSDINPVVEPEVVDEWKWPEVGFLEQDPSVYRIFPKADWYWGNYGAMVFEEQTLLGYESLYPRRYEEFLLYMGLAHIRPRTVNPLALDLFHPILDLLNVKYIVGADETTTDQVSVDLIESFPAAEIATSYARTLPIDLQGVARLVLAMEPGEVWYRDLSIPAGASLRFGVGVAEWAWKMTDGVDFEVAVSGAHGKERVFSAHLDPRDRPEDRGWTDQQVDLGPWAGQVVSLGFVITPGASRDGDMALWAEPLVVSGPDPARFEPVFTTEVPDGQSWHTWITYENKNVLPRAFVVHGFEVIEDDDALLSRLAGPGFDPGEVVLLEEHPAEATSGSDVLPSVEPPADVQILTYTPNEVTLQVEAGAEGFLILADSSYPGWRAYVDGREQKVYRADYILRAVHVEAGRHRIRFVFAPATFVWGAGISVAVLCIVCVLVARAVIVAGRHWQRQRTGVGGEG